MLHKIISQKIAYLAFVLFVSLVFVGSSLAAVPVVETRSATNIVETAANINGKIVSDGGSSIIERRFDWGTTPSGNGWTDWTANVSVAGDFFSYYLTGLNPGTTYYFRAWAKNNAGWWGNGSILSFTTAQTVQKPLPPTPTSPGTDTEPGSFVNLTPTLQRLV